MYVDGVLDGTEVIGSITVAVSSNPLTVGGGNDGVSEFTLNGRVDEVRVWNEAQSAAEIAANRTCCDLVGSVGLVGYWRFDEGSGSTTADATANNNDGTPVDDATWSTNVGLSCTTCD